MPQGEGVKPGNTANGNGGIEDEGQFTIEDSDEEEEDEDAGGDLGRVDQGRPKKVRESSPVDPLFAGGADGGDGKKGEEELLPSLIDRLFSCTIDLLFCAGFTVPESVRGQQAVGEKVNVSINVSK